MDSAPKLFLDQKSPPEPHMNTRTGKNGYAKFFVFAKIFSFIVVYYADTI